MAQITSSVGIISGINTGAIIDELMSLDQEPVTVLQTEINSHNAQMEVYSDMESKLQSLQTIGQSLELPQTFNATVAASSDASVLTASTTTDASQGTYQLQVAQLVTAQQSVSNGYSSTSSPLAAGTISIEMGGGSLSTQTALSDLNGGAGVTPGTFRITDADGNTETINTGSDVNLDDVVSQINSSLNVNVTAAIQGNHLVLTDSSSGSGTMNVADLAGGSAAQSLGIAGTAVNGTLTGSSIMYMSDATTLSSLNDGNGVNVGSGADDFTVAAADGSSFKVSLANAESVGDVINAINNASGGKVTASIPAGASGITLTDNTGGGGPLTVTDIDGSQAAQNLGIAQSSSTGVITGKPVVSGLDTVLVSSLKGGAGIALGTISITDHAGGVSTVDLSGAATVQDVLSDINAATGGNVTAALNSAGNGIQLTDNTTGSGSLVIADENGGATAQSLGIAGTYPSSQSTVNGGDLHLQYVSDDTALTSYNGGKGIGTGTFQITSGAGVSATIDLSTGTYNTLGDVMNAINNTNIGVTASINTNGNGILLTDHSGGAGQMTVTDQTGTSAASLNIAGTAADNQIDGAMEKTINVTSSDTLASLQAKFVTLGFGVTCSIINDGSAQDPYRLSFTATNAGTDGQVIIDTGTTGMQVRNLVNAQNAAVFVGGSGGTQPLLVTSSSNQINNVITGVTLSLQSASTSPVTVSITRDGSGVATQLQNFTDTFNNLLDEINTYSQYDTTTNIGGLLLGDPTTQRIQEQMYQVFNSVVSSSGEYRTLGDVGMTLTTGAQISFDPSAFTTAFAADPDSVKTLFTQTATGLGTVINNSMTSLVDPITGAITEENNTLTNQNTSMQTQITQLDSILADKRTLLETQFANMESVLATLQSQQDALNSFTKSSSTTSSSSSSSSASSASST